RVRLKGSSIRSSQSSTAFQPSTRRHFAERSRPRSKLTDQPRAAQTSGTKILPKLSDRLGDLFRVAERLHLLEHPRDLALAVDDEGRAVDPHVLLAEHALLPPDAEGFDDLVLSIGEE